MEKFDERQDTIQKAVDKYVRTGIEMNITKAYQMYLDEHPEEPKHPTMVTQYGDYTRPDAITSKNRPKCPECGLPMGLWEVNVSDASQVGKEFKTQWVCTNEMDCGYQDDYSTLTIGEQIEKYANL